MGVSPRILDLKKYDFPEGSPLMLLREAYFRAIPEVCIERPELVTKFHVESNLLNQETISILDKARVYRKVLENRKSVVWHNQAYQRGTDPYPDPRPFFFDDWSPFAGSTTSKFKGVLLYPELVGLMLWPELHGLPKRAHNPYQITTPDIEKLNFEIFPHWMNRSILEIARVRSYAQHPEAYHQSSEELKLMQLLVLFLTSKPLCISHTIPDFSRAIKFGLRGVINEAEQNMAAADTPAKREFYAAIIEVLEGIVAYSRNLAITAELLAPMQTISEKKRRLLEIAERYRRVPEHPATGFKDALTTIWVCWTALNLENPNVGFSLGRLDQVLYPLYRQDVDGGHLHPTDALELLCFFWLKIGDHVPMMPEAAEQLFGGTGANQAITIGGIDSQGNDSVNDVTYLILRATELMKLRDPNLNARYFPGINSEDYLRRLCEVNINTGATPAIHNDKAVILALQDKGDSLAHARDYGIVGCVEPVSAGRTYAHCAALLVNVAAVLELALFNGRMRHTGSRLLTIETGPHSGFQTFEQFRDAYRTQLEWVADRAVRLNNLLGEVHQDFYPTPILSSLFEGPMDKGSDVIQGGAKINSSGVSIIALADTADSLNVIRELCFNPAPDRRIPLSTMMEAISANFAGFDDLYARTKKVPKYGNDNPGANENAQWLVTTLDAAFRGKNNYRGGKYRVGYWTMTIHAGLSAVTGALPNGRKDGENFASGITPVSGVATHLTSALNSAAMLPSRALSSGVALNIKFAPEQDEKAMLDHFTPLIKGYFAEDKPDPGGIEIQFNIMDHETFLDAMAHPENYPYLLVRVSGYTAYFRDLSPQMQKEIMERTEYDLSSGASHSYHIDPES
jgi:pyruvate formate-lyase/glycerol dehydratase family glycyl radical enzyme